MSMQSFYKLRNELCIGKHEEVEILVVDKAHEGHQGIVKTKQLLTIANLVPWFKTRRRVLRGREACVTV